MDTNTTPAAKLTFETTECTRCGGSGHYSFNLMTGSRCFKCQGTGRQLSVAGARARKVYQEAFAAGCRTVAAADLAPGDVYVPGAYGKTVARWQTVVSVTPDPLNEGRVRIETVRAGGALGIHGTATCTVRGADAYATAVARVARLKGATVTYG